MKLKGTNVTGRDRETRKDNGQCARVTFVSWIQRYGCVEFVVGSLTYPRRGGGGSLSVPVFPGISTKPNPTKFTRILVRAMIGLLKMPLEICQSGERKIRNAFPVIR